MPRSTKTNTLDKLYDKYDTQMKEMLAEFDWESTRTGRMALLNNNKTNKAALRGILSQHPHWSFEDQAIILPITEDLMRTDLLACLERYDRFISPQIAFMPLANGISSDKHQQIEDQWTAIYGACAVARACAGLVASEASKRLQSQGIKAPAGKKLSRVISKWASQFPDITTSDGYNKVYANLADALCPIKVQRVSVLSINPVDFLLMAEGNGWTSCHCISQEDSHCHRTGPLSYMQDHTSMIFYTVRDTATDVHLEPKITRQMYHYSTGTLIQSRLYPNYERTELANQYRAIVHKVIADQLNMPNIWMLKRSQGDVSAHVCTTLDSSHYHDYR